MLCSCHVHWLEKEVESFGVAGYLLVLDKSVESFLWELKPVSLAARILDCQAEKKRGDKIIKK
ncbi:hypothetical protein BpHYR1_013086 [Brachionus plicatilis]|uniref:Uncharacterized protein n=1 Tax=Brachionus plicatilis TaxID=10195 RepID=A0A3M7PPZ5_BRAPC|nr:hypothetical protein BpHYR1_013086 [Brachionus plicatilis]